MVGEFQPPEIPTSLYVDPLTNKLIAPEVGLAGEVPVLAPLPSAEEMLSLSRAELTQELQRFGVVEPWPEYVADSQKYIKRMTGLAPGDPGFAEQLDNLVSPESRRALVGQNRRIQERWTTLEAVAGKATQQLIRVAEGDSETCAGCFRLSGSQGSLAQHAAVGMPGSQECGDNCRCQLMAIGFA